MNVDADLLNPTDPSARFAAMAWLREHDPIHRLGGGDGPIYLASREAVAEAGIDAENFGGPLFLASPPVELDWHDRLALYKGGDRENASDRILEVARGLNSSDMFDSAQFGTIADRLADAFGTTGLPITLSAACASGATAIQLGVEAIRRGECERALSIGADGSATIPSTSV